MCEQKLDIELLEKLHGFGGLIAYQVQWFDTTSWSIKTSVMTFDESVAKAELERLTSKGLIAVTCFSHMIKFDGAFTVKEPK